jgi:hypothetical protein
VLLLFQSFLFSEVKKATPDGLFMLIRCLPFIVAAFKVPDYKSFCFQRCHLDTFDLWQWPSAEAAWCSLNTYSWDGLTAAFSRARLRAQPNAWLSGTFC